MLTDEELLTRLKSVPSYALAHDIVLSSEQFEAAMMALARAVERAAYEKAIKACEEIGKEIVCPEECAEAIRSLMTQEKPT